jgi:predicted DNA-binding protein with PD1-like motif
MEYFSSSEIGRCFALRLDKGDYLLESINELIKDAVVISAIGTLDMCTLLW